MTSQTIIQEILAANPQISHEQILEKLQAEKTRTGGLLGDETLLRLIAAKFGVQVQQNHIQNSGVLSTSRLFAGLYDVTVAGRLIAVFPAKTFQGAEKSGKVSGFHSGGFRRQNFARVAARQDGCDHSEQHHGVFTEKLDRSL